MEPGQPEPQMDIGGLIYMLNQAGNALAQANGRIAQLASENQALRAALALKPDGVDSEP